MIGITNAQDLQIALPEGDIEMKIRGRVFAFTTAAALAASLGASVLASQASATTAHSFAGGYSPSSSHETGGAMAATSFTRQSSCSQSGSRARAPTTPCGLRS